jgi:hypothetical protein
VTLTAVNISFAVLKILRLPLSELCTALFEGFAACGNFSGLENPGCGCITSWHQLTGVPSAPYENFTLACHSEECSDEESVFDFSVLVEKNAKQMLHFVQHDTTANSDRPEGFVLLGGLCAFARDNQSFVAAEPRYVSAVNSDFSPPNHGGRGQGR